MLRDAELLFIFSAPNFDPFENLKIVIPFQTSKSSISCHTSRIQSTLACILRIFCRKKGVGRMWEGDRAKTKEFNTSLETRWQHDFGLCSSYFTVGGKFETRIPFSSEHHRSPDLRPLLNRGSSSCQFRCIPFGQMSFSSVVVKYIILGISQDSDDIVCCIHRGPPPQNTGNYHHLSIETPVLIGRIIDRLLTNC